MEEKAVKKLLHRRIKDLTSSSEFRNFLITLILLILIIFYLGGKPTFKEYQKRERIDLKSLISACLDAVEMGGKEVRIFIIFFISIMIIVKMIII